VTFTWLECIDIGIPEITPRELRERHRRVKSAAVFRWGIESRARAESWIGDDVLTGRVHHEPVTKECCAVLEQAAHEIGEQIRVLPRA